MATVIRDVSGSELRLFDEAVSFNMAPSNLRRYE